MARKEIFVTIDDDNRDKGKTFHITELPATEAQEIATQLLVAAVNCGMELKGDVFNMGMAELWQAGFAVISQVPYHFLKPILDRIDGCVQFHDKNTGFSRALSGDIEEVKTFFKLRAAAIKLHFDFFDLGGGLTSGQHKEANQTTA